MESRHLPSRVVLASHGSFSRGKVGWVKILADKKSVKVVIEGNPLIMLDAVSDTASPEGIVCAE